MKVIYKYAITGLDVIVKMPAGAKILTVQTQGVEPFIWALVDTDAPLVDRHLRLVPTGEPLNFVLGEYIGTVQFRDSFSLLVFHLFDQGEVS